ncbi:MAG: hypothetical protein A2Z26_03690 [Deltaproteobacteria bacterium RBG_16_66_15]|nr:MAG: hypothetical protein A2Z26_03690 [Deltaproteobacteria bacterium RBG_16_66_15]HAM34182.1 hypothetical protein [Deltaproteobacteria bacterium]
MGTAAPAREATIQAAGLDRQCHLFPLSGEDFLTPHLFFWDMCLTGYIVRSPAGEKAQAVP